MLGVLGLLYAMFTYSASTPFPGRYALLPVVGTGLILSPWNDQPNFARRVRILARLSGQWLPDSKGPNFFLAFVTSVGVAL